MDIIPRNTHRKKLGFFQYFKNILVYIIVYIERVYINIEYILKYNSLYT